MFADLAPRLFANGWRNLLPCNLLKGTTVKWGPLQAQDMTERTLAYFCEEYGSAPRVGMVFGPARPLVAIDVDVSEGAESEIVRSIARRTLPRTDFVRIGRTPKFVLLYRGAVQSRKPHRLNVEVFGSSGQVVMFGTHPETRQSYRWPGRSPLDQGPDDLPEITADQVEAFVTGVRQEVVREHGSGPPVGCDFGEALALERRMYGVAGAWAQLQRVTEGDRHHTLLSVTGYLVAALGYSPDETARFVDLHFPAHLRREQFRDVAGLSHKMAEAAITKFLPAEEDWSL